MGNFKLLTNDPSRYYHHLNYPGSPNLPVKIDNETMRFEYHTEINYQINGNDELIDDIQFEILYYFGNPKEHRWDIRYIITDEYFMEPDGIHFILFYKINS